MRILNLVLCGCALAVTLWLVPRGFVPRHDAEAAMPSQVQPLALAQPQNELRSHAVRTLIRTTDYPTEPEFRVLSPVPAKLADGVPPT